MSEHDDDYADLDDDEIIGVVKPETSIEADLKAAEKEIAEEAAAPEREAHEEEVRNEAEIQRKKDKTRRRIESLSAKVANTAKERDEALAFAENAWREAQALKARLSQTETITIAQAKQRATSEVDNLKAALKHAYGLGDVDKIAELQYQLGAKAAELEKLNVFQPTPAPRADEPNPVQKMREQPKGPSEKAQNWARENSWFGKDKRMTAFAHGVHEELIEAGYSPDSDEYYNEINKEVRKTFPDKFGVPQEQPRKSAPASIVAGVNRSPATSKPREGLTPSEKVLAKRLGVPEDKFLEQKRLYGAQ
jgi:hypothetical protein